MPTEYVSLVFLLFGPFPEKKELHQLYYFPRFRRSLILSKKDRGFSLKFNISFLKHSDLDSIFITSVGVFQAMHSLNKLEFYDLFLSFLKQVGDSGS